jgi:ParB family chromosome partitioning protein
VPEIAPNPHNPRSAYPEQALDELAASLREDGQLQPVLVRVLTGYRDTPDGPRYELIAGHRRWLAAQSVSRVP